MSDGAVIRFNKVSFNHGHNKPILDEVDFSVRRGSKITLMGQNGAGKSTVFKLITGEIKPAEGAINIDPKATIAVSKQVIPREYLELTIREFFEKSFKEKVYDIDPKIEKILKVVNLHAPNDRIVKSFSGGQQARLLLASALIQDPDILLLDEPTNNLDKEGVVHLTKFILNYEKTCIVISHDADFLNSFTQGVLYLNIFSFTVLKDHKQVTKKVQVSLKKNRHLLLSGPNGIGKSTLLESIAKGEAEGTKIAEDIKVGYYRQDFSTLDFDETVYDSLSSVMEKHVEEELRSVAAGFLITKDLIYTKIGNLSEGQKGLVAFAQLVLLKPNLLILDEPTNHINFRHLPIIAKALDQYEGAMILVSHVPEFVKQIRIDETLDLGK